MADNTTIKDSAGADVTVADDDVGGVKYRRVKLSLGADGTAADAVAGSGAVGDGVQRMTLASDDPAVASLSSLNAKAPALGQALAAASVPVVLPAIQVAALAAPVLGVGDNTVGRVGGNTVTPSATFNRPADTTAYASGDLVANSTTAGSVSPMSLTVARVAAGSGLVRRARLRKSGTGLTNASFRVHLYTSAPTVTNGDNGAWLTTTSGYLGAFDLTMDRAFSDGAGGIGVPASGGDVAFKLASGQTISALVEARAAYTPTSGETFTLELETLQD